MNGDRVIVVGGGIAGLAAGFRLRQAGLDVTVLESGEQVGGRMSTIQHEGYLLDVGATILLGNYREMIQLIAEAGLADQVREVSDLTGIVRDRRVHRFRGHSISDMARMSLLSPRAKLSLTKLGVDMFRARKALNWYDPQVPSDLDRETALDYAARRFNAEVTDYLIDPLCGVLAFSSPDAVQAVDILFYLRNALGTTFFSSPTGVAFLPQGLAAHLHVETNARVTCIEESTDQVTVTWERPGADSTVETASACVITVPAPQIPDVYPQLDATRAEILRSAKYATSVGVHLGLAAPPTEPSTMVLVPRREDSALRLVILDHNKFEGRAPTGKGLLTAWWHADWSEAHWSSDDGAVIEQALPSLGKLFPAIDGQVEMAYVHRWRHALVASARGRYGALTQLSQATDPNSRVQIAGDFVSTSTTNACLVSGQKAATRVLDAIQQRPPVLNIH